MTRPQDLEELRSRIVQQYDNLSPRLQQVAAFALENPRELALSTLAIIAERCRVQPSTIVRFAKTFGYDGASDMQKLFRDEMLTQVPSSSYAERVRESTEQAGDLAELEPWELMQEFAQKNILALEHMKDAVRRQDLDKALDLIGAANAVYIVGLRRSFSVAAYLAYALRHVDKRAYLIDGVAGMLAEQSGMMSAGDLLIATSFRPYAPETADIVAGAVSRGVPVIAISDSRVSPIARDASVCFEIKDAEILRFRSLTASLCLAQTLVISYAFRLEDRTRRKRRPTRRATGRG